MSRFKDLKESIIENQTALALLVFIVCTLIVVILTIITYGYSDKFFENVLVEAHGMLFDILIIGTFLFWLIKKSEKRLEIKRNIERYHDEIDDFRDWESEEAKFRIVGNIKRLNRNGVSKIYLRYCYLKDAILRLANLAGANLEEANLEGAKLAYANLRGAGLREANLKGANLEEANLEGVQLMFANLCEANLSGSNLKGADL